MLIQAVDVRTSPLLQLPHITQDMLKHFTTKKVQLTGKMDKIKTIANFYCLHHVWKVSRGIFCCSKWNLSMFPFNVKKFISLKKDIF